MAVKVYTISGAPRGWRVLAGLALKGIAYKAEYLEASKGEHKQVPFLQINPRGKIPVLEYNGEFIRDSLAILAWLDAEFPDRPLFGKTPDETRAIWPLTLECCDYLRAANDALLRSILVANIEPPIQGEEGYLALQTAGQALMQECEYLESKLRDNAFFSGTTTSAIEAIVFPEIGLIKRAIDKKPTLMEIAGLSEFTKFYPSLNLWFERVAALPNMSKTFPYHWT